MSGNDTNGLNSTVSGNAQPSASLEGCIIVYVLTLAAFTYGLISWCLIKKFRNYKNYTFLCTIFANLLLLTCGFIASTSNWLYFSTLFYFYTVKHYWLLVISHMFYVDFVKVFNGNINRKYLKSSIFSWGVPLIPTVGTLFFGIWKSDIGKKYVGIILMILFATLILPLVVNCILYIIILCSLCRSFKTNEPTTSNTCRRLSLATLIFILSDVSLLSSYIIMIVMSAPSPGFVLELLLLFWSTLVLELFLVVGKRNREVWSEYIERQLAKYRAK
ncbi:hypothetical protein PYW08_004944 [Mythimna loreyi]|uniref:Uncharacterized protein n=1 Tax=Mythimna loreyi TaxID=667449 RepID=A0ACC2QDN0_9NEOP|nr:hypothetical protein PYW08_004944 [Mythimna loreyi]